MKKLIPGDKATIARTSSGAVSCFGAHAANPDPNTAPNFGSVARLIAGGTPECSVS